ncbi:ATP-binding protein [Candidatus Babeliales bacterium]|nr:ATP-binding protein [Candidatus Babeliales bacterium]
MKRLPVSTHVFSKIISSDYVYIDKTEAIYQLIQGECYFFARPRRFGKSLLCSTLKSLFLGQKELFKGLWIDAKSDYKWSYHPVVHLDFLTIACSSPEELLMSIMRDLDAIAQSYNLEPLAFTNPGEMLKVLVKKLAQKSNSGVVIIIDEYDKAILDHLHNNAIAEKMRTILKNFYVFIKGLNEHLRFVLITGVSRFSQTSIFSGLNNMLDISMDPLFATLVGCNEQELRSFLMEHINITAANKKISPSELIDEMRTMYNGYRFWKDLPLRQLESGTEPQRIFNPFSVINALHSDALDNYWFRSGTPTFLIHLLKTHNYPVETLDGIKADLSELETFEIDKLSLTTLFYQTGYLTIKDYNPSTKNFTLTYPNQEVKDAFLNNILALIGEFQINQINTYTSVLRKALNQENTTEFIDQLKKFYALIPYSIHIDKEKYYQTIFFVLLKLIGAEIDVEIDTNIGRIDAVIETKKALYIIEFKLKQKASIALEQIKRKKYFERYLNDSRHIILIGITFDASQKNISDSLVEALDRNKIA